MAGPQQELTNRNVGGFEEVISPMRTALRRSALKQKKRAERCQSRAYRGKAERGFLARAPGRDRRKRQPCRPSAGCHRHGRNSYAGRIVADGFSGLSRLARHRRSMRCCRANLTPGCMRWRSRRRRPAKRRAGSLISGRKFLFQEAEHGGGRHIVGHEGLSEAARQEKVSLPPFTFLSWAIASISTSPAAVRPEYRQAGRQADGP